MKWRFSAFTDEAGVTSAQQIAAAVRARLNWIDIRNIDSLNVSVLPVEHARRIRGELDAAGIGVTVLASPIGKIDITDDFAGELAKLEHLAQLAPILGCPAIRVFSYYNQKAKLPHSEWQDKSLERLRTLKTRARELGLTLWHENEVHIFGDRFDDVLTLARELRDAHFKFIFDFGNFSAGGDDCWQAWLKLRDHTDAFHLKDNAHTQSGELYHVISGQGEGRVREILTDALARGFAGPLSVEAHLQHPPAVVSTGPSGIANPQYAHLSLEDAFNVAVNGARKLLESLDAPVV
jgi:sugar phosphate isomerase/epimerase